MRVRLRTTVRQISKTMLARGAGELRPYLESDRRFKLTDDDVKAIRSSYAAGGVSQSELARRYKVTATCIRGVLRSSSVRHRKKVKG